MILTSSVLKSLGTKLNSPPRRNYFRQTSFNTLFILNQFVSMSSPPKPWPAVQTTSIQTAPGVTLDDNQKTLVGSVLDVSPYMNVSEQ